MIQCGDGLGANLMFHTALITFLYVDIVGTPQRLEV